MQFYNLHTHSPSNDSRIVSVVNQYPWELDESLSHYSIGVHPWYINEARLEEDYTIIAHKLNQPQCLAIGECGLDKRIAIPFELQQKVFEKHIQLAEEFQKPMILHIVGAFDVLLRLQKKYQPTVPMIIHGFSKNKSLAQQLIAQGFYLSFGKYLLRNPELAPVFKSVPQDRFFLETDTVAEPIEAVYQVASDYHKVPVEAIQNQIHHNFNQVFSINNTK